MSTIDNLTIIINAKGRPPNCPFPSFIRYFVFSHLTKDAQKFSLFQTFALWIHL